MTADSGIMIVLQTQALDVAAEGFVNPRKTIALRKILHSHPDPDVTRKVVAELNDKHRTDSTK